MKAAQYHALKVGDTVLVKAKVTKLFPVGTMGNHRGWFEAELINDPMIGVYQITGDARNAEVGNGQEKSKK